MEHIPLLVVTMMMAQETRYVDLGLPSGILWADQNEPGVYSLIGIKDDLIWQKVKEAMKQIVES